MRTLLDGLVSGKEENELETKPRVNNQDMWSVDRPRVEFESARGKAGRVDSDFHNSCAFGAKFQSKAGILTVGRNTRSASCCCSSGSC